MFALIVGFFGQHKFVFLLKVFLFQSCAKAFALSFASQKSFGLFKLVLNKKELAKLFLHDVSFVMRDYLFFLVGKCSITVDLMNKRFYPIKFFNSYEYFSKIKLENQAG